MTVLGFVLCQRKDIRNQISFSFLHSIPTILCNELLFHFQGSPFSQQHQLVLRLSIDRCSIEVRLIPRLSINFSLFRHWLGHIRSIRLLSLFTPISLTNKRHERKPRMYQLRLLMAPNRAKVGPDQTDFNQTSID